MSSSKWRKARLALGCLQIPRTLEDDSFSSSSSLAPPNSNHHERRRISDVALSSGLSPVDSRPSPLTPTPSSSGLRLSRNSSKSSKKMCAICLNTMIPGQGVAIFTAECSHSFHFNCITSNVKHGNRICPVCRAKWKEIPFQSQDSELLRLKLRANSIGRTRADQPDANQSISSEPDIFDDDDIIEHQHNDPGESSNSSSSSSYTERVEIRTYPEVVAVPKSACLSMFTVLVHLKAPAAKIDSNLPSSPSNSRAPVDLVTVLDISGSMAGTKLALLKRAMGFVIQHLGPHDRLSVISFSSSARRVLPLRRMTDNGRLHALQAVNSLCSNGGTNISEGLKKGAKVMLERKFKNPVSSIILLSDGQDTYTTPGPLGPQSATNYKSLLPVSFQGTSFKIPVHTFGFGSDHDSLAMHSISENSGGTFSFIEAEDVIQDAFAQCMGGLLSVVAQELKVDVDCAYPGIQLSSIKAGSYHTSITGDCRRGAINIGDLYAEEERDILVLLNVPVSGPVNEMPLIKVSYSYKVPVTKMTVEFNEAEEVKIHRPETVEKQEVSIEVDRQRNRIHVTHCISVAKSAADRGDLAKAVLIIDVCRNMLSESTSAKANDPLCVSLENELKEMRERMANRQVYEESGRAYVLSGLSSHSWQRATARGDSTSSTNLSQAYQTSTMVDMITRSQTMIIGSSPLPPVRPPRSNSSRPRAQ